MNRKRLLICDDEEGVRESLSLILEDDHELYFASSGEEAINMLSNAGEKYDCMFLDIKMPGQNGLETLEKVRKLEPDLKVVIATGYQSVETAVHASRLGAADYITKPFGSAEVLEVVTTT